MTDNSERSQIPPTSNTSADPFNCPKCGAHDYGLHYAAVGGCIHCIKVERDEAKADIERLTLEWDEALGRIGVLQLTGSNIANASTRIPRPRIFRRPRRVEEGRG